MDGVHPVNLDAYHNFIRLLAMALAHGRADLALEFSAAMLVSIALDTEEAGLRYGPRMPS